MPIEEVPRRDLDSAQFLEFRRATEKIASLLKERLNAHLEVIGPLFTPRKLLGMHVRSSVKKDVPGSDNAFARLQQRYATVCDDPFQLQKELVSPLPPISDRLACTPYQYAVELGQAKAQKTLITSPTRYILAYESQCPLDRLKAMVAGTESRRAEDMQQSLVSHLCMGIMLEQYSALRALLTDLRYSVEIRKIEDLGGLPVVVINMPLATFLPSDDFILEITQLSGIPAFQEIIEPQAIEKMRDPLRDALQRHIAEQG